MQEKYIISSSFLVEGEKRTVYFSGKYELLFTENKLEATKMTFGLRIN